MLILPALVLVLAFCVFVISLMRLPGRTAAILGLYLLAYANIVLVGEISNSIHQLNNLWLWLGLHLVCAAAAWLVWYRAGRPDLWSGLRMKITPGAVLAAAKRQPELGLLSIGIALAAVLNVILIWIVPPNNNDSLSTHMSRIGYWVQRGSFFPWPTERVWQITYPVNMQLQMLWTVLFLGTDRIVEVVQWLGGLVAMVAIFGLARLLGASRAQSVFSALLWATFPEIILESTTTQNDLVAGTLFVAMFYLLFLGLEKRHKGTLALSGLALALGMGTKQTLFFLIPGLVVTLLLVLYYSRRAWLHAFRGILVWGSSVVAAFLLLGVYMFVVNQANFGHPLGPETAVANQTGGQTSQSLQENLRFNTFRLAYQMIDPAGLPEPLTGYGFKLKALVVGKLTSLVGFPVEAPVAVAANHVFVLRERYEMQEDAAWYGPLFSFLVLPALGYQFWIGLKRRDPLRISILAVSISFWILDAALRPGWDPFQGRYFIPVVAIATPVAAFFFQPGLRMAAARWLVVALALVVMTNTFLWSSAKPVTGEGNIWTSSRIIMVTQQSFYMREAMQMIEKYVPADATLGLLTFSTHLEYPFFRENFGRRLVQIYPKGRIHDVSWMQAQGIEYVLLLTDESSLSVDFPSELVPFASLDHWTLYSWAQTR